jgi:predicted GH43/DUF377 family glycosyl hydrolase
MFLLITVLVVSGTNSFAQYEWEKYQTNPLSLHGAPGSWDESVVTPCAIFNLDLNRYEMWYGSFTGTYPNAGIGFAYSSDGITWTKHPTAVMTPSATGWDSLSVGECSVIKEGSSYKMWYTGHKNASRTPSYIGYATSPDGITWTKYSGNPVLSPGSGWESARVEFPSVIKVTGGYWMFYTGELSHGIARTGRAFSTDGINWQRDLVNNPVLKAGASGEWDQNNYLGNVIELNNALYIYYTGETNPGVSGTAIGVATSTDMGINWTKYSGNPIVQRGASGQWDNGWIETGCAVFAHNQLKLYYDGGGAATGWFGRIGLAISDPLPAGTYTIGTGGNFATIQEAFDKLSTDGIAGEVILELIDNLYTAPTDSFGFHLEGPILGAGLGSRVTIKPAQNKNVTIEGIGFEVMSLTNASFITLDGNQLTGNSTLTFHAIYNNQFSWNSCLDFWNNSDHNIIQNITFICEDVNGYGGGPGFWTLTNNNNTAPDSNLIQNNFIPKTGNAIYISSNNSTARAKGNIIRDNLIGSETDSLINWGIQVEHCQNTIIENNIIQNIKAPKTIGEILNLGINSYSGDGDIIRNNVIHNMKSSIGYSCVGILLSGGSGSNNMVYNNMVYDIQSSSTQSNSRVTGIQIWNQTNPKIYYNTVYLSGAGANHAGSAALYIYGGFSGSTGVDVKNNIFINTRDESPYFATAIYDYSASNLTSDYNDLYSNNYLVRIGGTNYNTLAEWQATGHDINSVNKPVNFVSATDLHLTGLSNGDIDLAGIPIAGITTDIEGDTRNSSFPYKGADEASVSLPVELKSFTAQAENQKVILRWTTATELNNNGFEIQRKVAESDFATIGFVRGEGTTTNQIEYSYIDKDLTDGKYFYRLKQFDFNGSYEFSNVIEVDVRSLNEYVLEQNYPNPFNPTTTIGYVLREKTTAKLLLLNAIGEEIAVLVNEEQHKGFHKVDFNAANLPSGVYFYQLKAGDFISVKKMILLK